jgi:hypothetical protein
MRALSFFAVASGFATIFLGMVLVSAVLTSAMHTQLQKLRPPHTAVLN